MENEKTNVTLKPADYIGKVIIVKSARTAAGKFGPQVAMRTEDGHVAYVSAKSGIAKGLASQKLKVPLRLTAETAYGDKGAFAVWALAPRAQ
jgi:hypothetical protein